MSRQPKGALVCTQPLNSLPADFLCKGALTINFTPTANRVSFSYVFASEEYNEYVGTQYNDAFAFFLNGVNIALLPDSSAVAINNVNLTKNATYFTDNTVNTSPLYSMFQYDGFVGVSLNLYASGFVNVGEQNTIKLAIADLGDSSYDSAVFLGAGSFRNELPPVTSAVPEPSTYALAGAVGLMGLSALRRFRRKNS